MINDMKEGMQKHANEIKKNTNKYRIQNSMRMQRNN
jgi:hypothetical protein